MSRDAQRLALRSAALWLSRLAASPEDPGVHSAWLQLRQADATHGWAWQRVEQMQ